jgi:hypothetical protein
VCNSLPHGWASGLGGAWTHPLRVGAGVSGLGGAWTRPPCGSGIRGEWAWWRLDAPGLRVGVRGESAAESAAISVQKRRTRTGRELEGNDLARWRPFRYVRQSRWSERNVIASQASIVAAERLHGARASRLLGQRYRSVRGSLAVWPESTAIFEGIMANSIHPRQSRYE